MKTTTNTNTTTTTRAAIMSRAHAMTRTTLEQFPDDDYRAVFAAALRIAWQSVTAAAQWDAMSGDAQYDALIRMTYTRKRHAEAETTKSGNYRENEYAWISCADDALNIAAEAWALMPHYLAKNAERDIPEDLRIVMCRACDRAARSIKRNEYRTPTALRMTADGEYIDTARTLRDNAENPENAALLRAALDASCADDIDREIMKCRECGYTQTEISERVTMSQRAVSKRIQRMYDRFSAERRA